MRSTRRQKPHITNFTHRCPVGHEWKSMLANAKNCPECRRIEIARKRQDEGEDPNG